MGNTPHGAADSTDVHLASGLRGAEEPRTSTPLFLVSVGLFALGILSALGADFGFHAVGPFLPVSDIDALATHQYRFWYALALVALIASALRRKVRLATEATMAGLVALVWLACEALWGGPWI